MARARTCRMIFATIFGVLATGALVTVIFTVLQDFNAAENFKQAQCKVTKVQYLGSEPCRYCYSHTSQSNREAGARRPTKTKCPPSSYPCFRVDVRYENQCGTEKNATYYTDAVQASQSRNCSIYACRIDAQASDVAVHEEMDILNDRRSFGKFECYYDSTDSSLVIGRKVYPFKHVLTALLIPGVVAVLAFIFLICSCCIYNIEWVKGERDGGSDSDSIVKFVKIENNDEA